MNIQYIIITSFLYGIFVSLIFINISHLLVKPRRTKGKIIEYESGVNPLESKIVYFARRYFRFIVAYVVFDVIVSFLIILTGENASEKYLLSYMVFTLPPAVTLFASYHLGYLKWGK